MIEYVLLNAGASIRTLSQRAVLFAQGLDWKVVVGIAFVALFLAVAMKPGTRH
jgi:hypothetical protein